MKSSTLEGYWQNKSEPTIILPVTCNLIYTGIQQNSFEDQNFSSDIQAASCTYQTLRGENSGNPANIPFKK